MLKFASTMGCEALRLNRCSDVLLHLRSRQSADPAGLRTAILPHIETHPDMVIFDARGLEGLHGPPESLGQAVERIVGIPASIAIASNPDAAVHAAQGIKGVTVIPPGKESRILARSASQSTWWFPGCRALPRSLGNSHLRRVCGLCLPIGVAARLGDEGTALQRLASGAGARRLRAAKEELTFDAEMELDTPIELLESLCFVFQRLLDELLAKLVRVSLATNEIRVRLALERAPDHRVTLRLPVPMTGIESPDEDAVSGAE